MRKTTNLGLTLYDGTDRFIITGESGSLNSSMEKIDTALTDVREMYTSGFHSISTTIANQYVASNGAITPYSGWSTSEYMGCEHISQIQLQMPRTGRWLGLYDANKQPIKAILINSTNLTTIDLPEGTCYWVISEDDNYVNKIKYKNTLSIYIESMYKADLQKKKTAKQFQS